MMKVHACACEWCCRCYSLYSSYSVVFLFLPLLLFLFLFLLPLLLLLVLVQCELHEKQSDGTSGIAHNQAQRMNTATHMQPNQQTNRHTNKQRTTTVKQQANSDVQEQWSRSLKPLTQRVRQTSAEQGWLSLPQKEHCHAVACTPGSCTPGGTQHLGCWWCRWYLACGFAAHRPQQLQ